MGSFPITLWPGRGCSSLPLSVPQLSRPEPPLFASLAGAGSRCQADPGGPASPRIHGRCHSPASMSCRLLLQQGQYKKPPPGARHSPVTQHTSPWTSPKRTGNFPGSSKASQPESADSTHLPSAKGATRLLPTPGRAVGSCSPPPSGHPLPGRGAPAPQREARRASPAARSALIDAVCSCPMQTKPEIIQHSWVPRDIG